MQTFNLFPELFSFSMLSSLILRVVVGFIFLNLGLLKIGREKAGWITSLELLKVKPAEFFVVILGLIEIAGGIMFILGYSTQLTALILGVISLIELLIEYKEESIIKRDFVFYLLLTAICASLLITGAGLFAIDMPLL